MQSTGTVNSSINSATASIPSSKMTEPPRPPATSTPPALAEPKVYEHIVYKGEPGKLTLTAKTFHYQANNVEAQVKCSWNKVEKRQLSPPGAPQALIKLILLSGRTAVFEVKDTRTLLQLVKDVKLRMDHAATAAPKLPADGPRQLPPKNPTLDSDNQKPSPNHKEEEKTTESSGSSDGVDLAAAKKQRQSSILLPPPVVSEDPEEFPNRTSTTTKKEEEEEEEEKPNKRKSPWAFCCSIYCWILLAALVIIGLILALFLVYWFLLRDDSGSSNNNNNDGSNRGKPRSLCNNTSAPDCPPDDGLEDRYGIRGVEYVWTPAFVRLEYYISDYILDSSVNYTVYDGENCRNSEDLPLYDDNNKWLKVELVDGAPQDGGANLYNEGKGTRQFDVVLSPRWDSQLGSAPFYTGVLAATNESRGYMRVCVGFKILYNNINEYVGKKEVNYIENALQMTVDKEVGVILDVQVRTVTQPTYKLR